MKIATLLILVITSLAGCVVAPLGGPADVYVAAPAIVVQPYGYSYGYYGGPRHRHWR